MVTVTYNSYSLPNVYGKLSISEDEKTISFGCNFFVTAATSALLINACAQAETALTEINKDFVATLGGSTEFSFAHSTNTGFLARPHLEKLANDLALGVGRAYRFTVEIGLPFPQSGYNYRREASFDVTYQPNRGRSISLTMLYTAGGANSGLQNYTANGKTWAASILTLIGGNYELTDERIQEEMEQKICNAHLTYREILAYQSAAGYDYTAVVNPQCDYSVNHSQSVGLSDGGYTAYPIATVTISYNTTVSKDVVAAEGSIDAVYENTVKTWLIAHAYDMLGLGQYSHAGRTFVLQSEHKDCNPHNYTISGRMTFMALKSSTAILELSESITTDDDLGLVSEKLWDGVDHTYNLYSVGAKRVASRSITISQLNVIPGPPIELGQDGNGNWVLLRRTMRKEAKLLGSGTRVHPPTAIICYFVNYHETYLYVVPAVTVAEFTQPQDVAGAVAGAAAGALGIG